MERNFQKIGKNFYERGYNMYNYYQQQPNSTAPFNPRLFSGLKGHPVSSLEEVKASSIDFDGSIFYFPDIANKRIYTKTVGLDGVALLNMYELKPIPTEPDSSTYVTREEFDQALARVSELLATKVTKAAATTETPPPQNYKEVF